MNKPTYSLSALAEFISAFGPAGNGRATELFEYDRNSGGLVHQKLDDIYDDVV